MVYEGAIIRRIVTPNHPGDPLLDNGDAFRTEYVLADPQFVIQGRDAKTDQIRWTTDLGFAFVYPRHLDADLRAKQISPHCYARVVRAPSDFSLSDLNGGRETGAGEVFLAAPARSGAATVQATLPAEVRQSARAAERPTRLGEHDDNGGQSTSVSSSTRAAGKSFSRKRKRNRKAERRSPQERMQALRAAAERTDPNRGQQWWHQGQYA
jgi:hypothetical protein